MDIEHASLTSSWIMPLPGDDGVGVPSELSVLFKNLETINLWGQNASDRTNWIDEVDFDVPAGFL